MPELAVLLIGYLLQFLYARRGAFAWKYCHVKVNAGDYEGALRRLHRTSLCFTQTVRFHHEGWILLIAGQPEEAEAALRKALAHVEAGDPHQRERLYSLLGHTLTKLRRYDEAEEWLHRAIRAGDVTGNSEDGLAELFLAQGKAEEALAFANDSIEIAGRRLDRHIPPGYYLDRALAFALLGRNEESREDLARVSSAGTDSRYPASATIGTLEWKRGMVYRALGEQETAHRHFRNGFLADPNAQRTESSVEMVAPEAAHRGRCGACARGDRWPSDEPPTRFR